MLKSSSQLTLLPPETSEIGLKELKLLQLKKKKAVVNQDLQHSIISEEKSVPFKNESFK